jgi:glucose/arabinose dehydrogenase
VRRNLLTTAAVAAAALALGCFSDQTPNVADAMPPDSGSDVSVDSPKGDDVRIEREAAPEAAPEAGCEPGTEPSADATPPFNPDASYAHFCDLPGSVQFTASGWKTVPSGEGTTNPECGQKCSPWWCFLHLPPGYCAHAFGNIAALAGTGVTGGNVRQLRFAPNGDLFVASPTSGTTGGGPGGLAAILVLPDDNRDGLADTAIRFAQGLPSTQGMLFANGHFYYQDSAHILRVPYAPGDRKPSGPAEQVADTSAYYTSSLHWPKTMDQADDGSIYVANGSDQEETCDMSRPFRGGILKLDGSPSGKVIAKGFRNPIAVRCQQGHNLCFAAELAKDYSAGEGGREKLVPIREGDDWGFPCCATKGLPYAGLVPTPDCSAITPDDVSFFIGDTPFSFDFERGKWPAPYTGSAFVPLHGAAGSWAGARIVAVATDPTTGALLPGSNIDGGSHGSMSDFVTGYEDGTRAHGRPAAIEFAPDGRMFVGNDNNGDIFWIAPVDLAR